MKIILDLTMEELKEIGNITISNEGMNNDVNLNSHHRVSENPVSIIMDSISEKEEEL